jgi:hypothetical protein
VYLRENLQRAGRKLPIFTRQAKLHLRNTSFGACCYTRMLRILFMTLAGKDNPATGLPQIDDNVSAVI